MGDIKQSVRTESKKSFKMPEGAELISQTENITVREVENGFLLSKSYDVKYSKGGENHYDYYTREWYSKENPVKITLPKEKSLADKLD